MRFVFKPKHLEIKFSFKEILFILIRGCFRLERNGLVDSETGEIIKNERPDNN